MSERWMGKVKSEMKRKGTEGVFSADAKRHGESTHTFAIEKEHSKGKVGHRARLALAFEKSAKHRHGG